jgi:hypothetical protein
MAVVVTPPSTIKVRVGSVTQPRIQSTSTFSGASSANVATQVQYATDTANSALLTSTSAYNQANSAYVLASGAIQSTGGEITGNLIVDGTLTAQLDGGGF